MNPFRFVPLIIVGLISGEVFQSVIGLLNFENQGHTLPAAILAIASALCHLTAFYFAWMTVGEIRRDVRAPQERTPADSSDFSDG